MKYRLFIFIILILAAAIYKYLLAGKPSAEYTRACNEQRNPFTVHKDSAAIIWQRAKLYLDENKPLIAGGDLTESDSVLFIPYYNSYKKGSSVRIAKHTAADSVTFFVQWWYSKNPEPDGEKEIALFMQQNISRR